MCFVEERSERLLVTLNCALSATNLVIRDSIGYILDEPVQRSGVILVPQEFQQPVLFREWLEFYNDLRQPSTCTLSERYCGECWGSKMHKPAKQFPSCLFQVIAFPERRAEDIRE